MKVTKELNGKIIRLVNEKYEKEVKQIEEEIKDVKIKHNEKHTEEIYQSIKDNRYMIYYIENRAYRFDNLRTYISDNLNYFIKERVDVSDFKERLREIERQKSMDIENIIIGISYEKNLDGVKKIFEDMEMEF